MVWDVIYSLLSAVCSVIAVNGLLTKVLCIKKNAFLVVGMTVIHLLVSYMGHISGLFAIGILLILVSVLSEECKLFNLFLACLGYLFSVTCNNIVLAVLDRVFGVSATLLISDYLYVFTVLYSIFLCIVMYFLRKILYEKIKIQKIFVSFPKMTQYCLTVNLLMYGVIFIVTISLGERAGYNSTALTFNSVLFVACMLVSSVALLQSTKGVENEEKQKAAKKQREILESYVESLENLVGEMRAFRHDYKNILASMAGYIREGNIEELQNFFEQKMELPVGNSEVQMEAWKCLKNVEPMELKGFLYEKLLLILTRDILVQVKVSDGMKVSYGHMEDLIRILGVFIDNAIEEVETLAQREINIEITKTEMGVVFEVSNNYGKTPNIARMGQESYSTKGEGRGNGLWWAEKLLGKHGDMFHELKIEHGKVIQRLEVSIN